MREQKTFYGRVKCPLCGRWYKLSEEKAHVTLCYSSPPSLSEQQYRYYEDT